MLIVSNRQKCYWHVGRCITPSMHFWRIPKLPTSLPLVHMNSITSLCSEYSLSSLTYLNWILCLLMSSLFTVQGSVRVKRKDLVNVSTVHQCRNAQHISYITIQVLITKAQCLKPSKSDKMQSVSKLQIYYRPHTISNYETI